jgi:hypothetical protein
VKLCDWIVLHSEVTSSARRLEERVRIACAEEEQQEQNKSKEKKKKS